MAQGRRQLLEEAERAARRGDFAACAAAYRRLLAHTPNDLVILHRLGDAVARAGQEAEARKVFRQLAEQYWRGGLKPRALAALRRATRLGPPDASLLKQLGDWTLDAGLAADAREPVLQAVQMFERSADIAAARELLERLADALGSDPVLEKRLLQLIVEHGAPQERAEALRDHAERCLAADDRDGALDALGRALNADPEELSAIAAFRRRVEVWAVAAANAPLPQRLTGVDGIPAVGWELLRASAAVLAGAAHALVELQLALDASGVLPAAARIDAARIALEGGAIEGAARVLLGIASDAAAGPSVRKELMAGLSALVTVDPGQQEAMDALLKLAGGTDPAPVAAAKETAAAPQAVLDPHATAPRAEPLPQSVQASLLEARALAGHGLTGQAMEVINRVPAGYRSHPEVEEIVRACREPAAITNALTAPRETRVDAGASDADDLIFIDLDEGAEAVSPAAARPEKAPPDLGELGRQIRGAIAEDDFETEYQMALGLVEMGLGGEAAPLLERVLHSPSRMGDAALILIRVRREQGDDRAAEGVARQVLGASSQLPVAVEVEILGQLVELLEDAGRANDALAWRRRLDDLG